MSALPSVARLVLPAIAAVVSSTTSVHALDLKGLPQPAFNKVAYEARLRKAFDGDSMGYATVLIKNGQVVSAIANGQARSAIDGDVKMTVNTPSNVGSSIKFTAGIALLKLFESKDPNINPKGLTADQWLDSLIWPHLPKAWQTAMDDSIRLIKFRHLLQHKSGFRALASGDKGTDDVKRMVDYLIKGVQKADMTRDYENANFSLITYLIPMVASASFRAVVDAEAAKKGWHAESHEIHQRIANAWEDYQMSEVYAKITPAIRPSCNPSVEYPPQAKVWAYDYKNKADTGKGATWDERTAIGGYCQGQGGWYLSALELAAFVANFDASETLVSHSLRGKLFDDDKADDRMVWSRTIADKAINAKYNYSQLPFSGGMHKGSRASILALPGGYYAVGMINSADYDSLNVTRRLLRAFKTGVGIAEDTLCATYPQQLQQAENDVAARKMNYQKAVAGGNSIAINSTQLALVAALNKLGNLKAAGDAAVCSM